MKEESRFTVVENVINKICHYANPLLETINHKLSPVDASTFSIRDNPVPLSFDADQYQYIETPSEKCKTVYMSKRTYTSVLAEGYSHGINETGGPFFGHFDTHGNWYIIETTGPGYGAYHTPTRHEMNNRFVNYEYRTLSRLYSNPLTLLGFWHRHPGTFNQFSCLDDAVNESYTKAVGNGTISILLNFTSTGPILTCYYLDPDDNCYHRTPLIISSKAIAQKGLLAYASPKELMSRAKDMQEAMKDFK